MALLNVTKPLAWLTAKWSRLFLVVGTGGLFFAALSYLNANLGYYTPAYYGPTKIREDEVNNGFLSWTESLDLCKERNLRPYNARDRPRKIYDLFLINTELDWLEIRLSELYDSVDYLIILEADESFQGPPKELHLLKAWDQFKPYHDKMIRQTINMSSAGTDIWGRERFCRNSLYDIGLAELPAEQQPALGDVIIVSDIDEIPKPSTTAVLRNCAFPARVLLFSAFYYYSFQWRHHSGHDWQHPQATYYAGEATVRPEDLRMGPVNRQFPLLNAAWHCSSCMSTLDALVDKIKSFSHANFNRPYYLDRKRLLHVVREGIDLFERPSETYDRVKNNQDVPLLLKTPKGREKYAYLLDRDPANGNFADVVIP